MQTIKDTSKKDWQNHKERNRDKEREKEWEKEIDYNTTKKKEGEIEKETLKYSKKVWDWHNLMHNAFHSNQTSKIIFLLIHLLDLLSPR